MPKGAPIDCRNASILCGLRWKNKARADIVSLSSWSKRSFSSGANL